VRSSPCTPSCGRRLPGTSTERRGDHQFRGQPTFQRHESAGATADGREHGDLVTVVEDGGVAGEGFVAVDPDARGVEHSRELGAVRRAQVVEQRAEIGGGALVVTASRRFARLREQPDADAQCPAPSMLVRAVGNASRRAGSIGSPVTSSIP
jgi:hypothetical protein